MKKHLIILSAVMFIVALFSIGVFADDIAGLSSMDVLADGTEGLSFAPSEDGTSVICTGLGTSTDYVIFIPSTYNGLPVRGIAPEAFYGSQILYIYIPNTVTSIGNRAFYKCGFLQSICIPDSVTTIGEYVFASCSSLKSVTIGNGLTSISNYAFHNCKSLVTLTIGNNVKSIGERALYYCSSLETLYIPDNVETIGLCAMRNNPSLKSVFFGNGITDINIYNFVDCPNLTDIHFPFGANSISGAPWGASASTFIHYNGGTYAEGYQDGIDDYKNSSEFSNITANHFDNGYNAGFEDGCDFMTEELEFYYKDYISPDKIAENYISKEEHDFSMSDCAGQNYNKGYNAGYTDGLIASGGASGDISSAYDSGYSAGYNQGHINGYKSGYSEGKSAGLIDCKATHNEMLKEEYDIAYSVGYGNGYDKATLDRDNHYMDILKDYLSPSQVSALYYSKQYVYDNYVIKSTYESDKASAYEQGYNAGVIASSGAYSEGYNKALEDVNIVSATAGGIFDSAVTAFRNVTDGVSLFGLSLQTIFITLISIAIIAIVSKLFIFK